MPSFTTFDKALAAFFGSVIAMLTMLGFTVPEFFSGAGFQNFITVVLPSLIPFVMTFFAKNKT